MIESQIHSYRTPFCQSSLLLLGQQQQQQPKARLRKGSSRTRWALLLVLAVMRTKTLAYSLSRGVGRRGRALAATDSRDLRFHNGVSDSRYFFDSQPALGSTSTQQAASSSSSLFSNPPPTLDYLFAATVRTFTTQLGGEEHQNRLRQGYGDSIVLTDEERDLFTLLRRVRKDTHLDTTLRVAGGWVRDKLLATAEFQAYHTVFEVGTKRRLTSKFKPAASMGRQGVKVLGTTGETCQPVDIDIALDDMLGREFADHLNEYLSANGEDTVSVGVVLKNPEKSKHLETATMKVGSFWIDFVNLRAEEYTQNSRIPDLMRIGTAQEDAMRRDLTINSLFYNVNTGEVEDWTGRGFDDLRRGIVATPLPPLTTLLDDPLRVLRSIRFAARLRFTMDEDLVRAAKDVRVRTALAHKVSRERVGGEVDLMLRSPDPVGAMRLLVNLNLADTVFAIQSLLPSANSAQLFQSGVEFLQTSHDHCADCRISPPIWCQIRKTAHGTTERRLTEDDEARRLLWYSSFLKPVWDECKRRRATGQEDLPVVTKRKQTRKDNRSPLINLLVDELKRPVRDAEAVEKVLVAADEITEIIHSGGGVSATMILLSEIQVVSGQECRMNGRSVDPLTEEDPVWEHAMDFRLACSRILQRIGPLWRAAVMLSIAEQLVVLETNEYAIEGDVIDESNTEERLGAIERYDVFSTALQQLSLIGIWNEKPLLDGQAIKTVLPGIPKGPAFRDVMDEQRAWMVTHPGAPAEALEDHLRLVFVEFVAEK
jgi:tRNA nucleotidyltransferase/poly(A) polymerase